MTPDARRWLTRGAKLALLAVVLAFVARSFVPRLQQLRWDDLRGVSWPLVLAATAFVALTYCAQALTYGTVLRALGARLPTREVLAVTWAPILAKYVPGKVAAVAAGVVILRRRGVGAPVALSAVLLQDGLAVLAGLVVGGRLFVDDSRPGLKWLALAGVVAGVVCMHPAVYGRLLDAALRALKKPPLPTRPRAGAYLVPALTAVGQWALTGTALWLAARAAWPALPLSAWPALVSVSAGAMTVGYLAFFTAGGVGPRDGLLLLGLTAYLPGEKAALVAVGMRVLHTGVEVALFAVGQWLLRAPPVPSPGTPGEG